MLHRNPANDRRSNRVSVHLPAPTLAFIVAVTILPGWQTSSARAQARPGDADLASIMEQLTSRHREGSRVEFVDVDPTMSPTCRMTTASMKVSRGNDAKSFPVLIENHGGGTKTRQMFAKLGRISVDADGAGRAYHPDDPFGDPACNRTPDPSTRPICALDSFSNGGMRLFEGATRLKRPDPKSQTANEPAFLPNWRDLWPLIRDQKLVPLRLSAIAAPDGPRDFNLIHWPERNLTFAFNTRIIPSTRKGFPCRYGQDSEYSGYFLSATTFKKASRTRADGCKSAQYLDAEKIPFFVVPAGKFGGIELGDIAIGFLRTPTAVHIAYGIAGDTGPHDHFGEASIAFNQALLDQRTPVENARDVDKLDIDVAEPGRLQIAGASLAVLVLGGTRKLLGGDYSAANIRKIGEAQFKRWSANVPGGDGRLIACFDAAR